MPVPLFGILAASVVAGVGLSLGKRICDDLLIPWGSDVAESWNQWTVAKEPAPRSDDHVPPG